MTFAKDAENYNENHLGVSVLVVYKKSRYGYFYLARRRRQGQTRRELKRCSMAIFHRHSLFL